MRKIEVAVPPAFDGKKLYSFLKGQLQLSSKLIRSLKQTEDGLCVGGVHVRTIDLLHTGDIVSITLPEDKNAATPGQTLPDVIYEDDDLLIVNKAPLMPIHESHNHQGDTLQNAVARHLLDEGKRAAFRAVGRLDKGTSGLVVCALNSHAAARLSGQIEKTYVAIATGVFHGSGTVDAPIFRPDPMKTLRAVGAQGDRAVTHWTALGTDGENTLLEIRLETGRTHQIRVHFAHLGAPLLGDAMYGTSDPRLPHQALHCGKLTLIHPVTGERLQCEAPMPDAMAQIAAQLKMED